MRRALTLIIGLTALMLAMGFYCDGLQAETARGYRRELSALRERVMTGDMEGALGDHAYMHARWQGDELWLNCLISHEHTRAVNTGMLKLSTALEMGWDLEALTSIDDIDDALSDIEKSDSASWENVL